jgi:hypothetical protein
MNDIPLSGPAFHDHRAHLRHERDPLRCNADHTRALEMLCRIGLLLALVRSISPRAA